MKLTSTIRPEDVVTFTPEFLATLPIDERRSSRGQFRVISVRPGMSKAGVAPTYDLIDVQRGFRGHIMSTTSIDVELV